MSVGSVSVEVVPDAEQFWAKFRAKTQAGADPTGKALGDGLAKGVGSQGDKAGDEFSRKMRARMDAALKALPKANVDADTSPADRQLQQLRANLARLTDKRVLLNLSDDAALATLRGFETRLREMAATAPDVRVRVDTGAAQAQLAALRTELGLVEQESDATGERWFDSQRSLGLLGTGIATLIPGAVTLGGALAAAAVAAGLLGASGVLAILGIRREMQAGTPIGQQYAADISALKSDLGSLEHSAASGFLGPFNAAVAASRVQLRQLNPEIHDFAAVTGDISGHVLSALIGGFHALNPLFSQLAVDADRGAAAFDRYANGAGLVKFQTFVQANLPQVIDTIEGVAAAAGHVIGAVGPLSGTSLTILRTLAQVINSMPTPVITALATAFITLKTASTGLSVLGGVARSLDKIAVVGRTQFGGKGTGLAAGLTAAGGAGLILSGVMFGLTSVMDENARRAQQLAQYTQSYISLLKDSHGVVTTAINDQVLQNAASDGVIDQLKRAGVSAAAWTQAVEQGGDAYNQLQHYLLSRLGSAILIDDLYQQRKAFTAAQKALRDYTDATTANNQALAQQNPGLAYQARALGLTVSALQTAQTAAEKKTLSDEQAAAVQQVLVLQNYQLAGTQQSLADQYGITTAQVQSYASMLGITQDQVEQGKVSASAYAAAVSNVADAENTATATGATFLQAVQAFASSAGTAADRAALIGATLRAANGDTLPWTAAMNAAAVAADQVKQALDGGARSVVDWRTGAIDYTKAGAAPLIGALGQLQDAAMKAAEAQYQHEVATKGGKVAADDAYRTYAGQTRGSLIDQARQLGITTDQARRLADRYFGMPKDVKTRIAQEGADPILSVLGSINRILTAIARSWGISVTANTGQADANLTRINSHLKALRDKRITVTVDQVTNYYTGANKITGGSSGGGVKGQAFGGWVTGPGQRGVDSELRVLAPGEFVVQEPEARRHAALLEAINAGVAGMAVGGTVTSSRPAPAVTSGATGGAALRVAGGRLEITRDSAGRLESWVKDLILAEQSFVASTVRMG